MLHVCLIFCILFQSESSRVKERRHKPIITGGERLGGGVRNGVLAHWVVDGVLVGETVQSPVSLSHLGVDTEVPGVEEVRTVSAESFLFTCTEGVAGAGLHTRDGRGQPEGLSQGLSDIHNSSSTQAL